MNLLHQSIREVLGVLVLAIVMFSPAALVRAQDGGPHPPSQGGAPPPPSQSGGPVQGMPDLVAMLKATPGCLGVDAARTMSGKQVIFAWFENKKAVVNWYYSDGHQRLIKTLASGGNPGRTPLADIADDSGPILTIASLTLSDRPQVGGVQLPVSQIAIELYAPLPGGLAAGGRFAPNTVKVKGLVEVPLAK
jgi:hypothetical protein